MVKHPSLGSASVVPLRGGDTQGLGRRCAPSELGPLTGQGVLGRRPRCNSVARRSPGSRPPPLREKGLPRYGASGLPIFLPLVCSAEPLLPHRHPHRGSQSLTCPGTDFAGFARCLATVVAFLLEGLMLFGVDPLLWMCLDPPAGHRTCSFWPGALVPGDSHGSGSLATGPLDPFANGGFGIRTRLRPLRLG